MDSFNRIINESFTNSTDINKFHRAVDSFITRAKNHQLTEPQLKRFNELIKTTPLAITSEQKQALRALKEMKAELQTNAEPNTLISQINSYIPDFFFPSNKSFVKNLSENEIFGEIFRMVMAQTPDKTQEAFHQDPIMARILSLLPPDEYKKAGEVFKGNVPLTQSYIDKINSDPEQSLKELGLTDVPNLITFLEEHGSKLKKLNLSEFIISNQEIKEIVKNCPRLEQLKLSAFNLDDEGIAEIAVGCRMLTSLDIIHCNQVTDRGVDVLVEGLSSLKALHISHAYKVTGSGVDKITIGLPELTALTIRDSYLISQEGFRAIAERLKGLTSLNLGYTNITNTEVEQIARSLKELTTLNLDNCSRLNGRIIGVIATEMPQLKSLDCSYNSSILDSSFDPFPHFGELEQINLYYTEATYRTYARFIQLAPDVKVIGLSIYTGRGQ